MKEKLVSWNYYTAIVSLLLLVVDWLLDGQTVGLFAGAVIASAVVWCFIVWRDMKEHNVNIWGIADIDKEEEAND